MRGVADEEFIKIEFVPAEQHYRQRQVSHRATILLPL
jgi:hypothetical protein